jgi:DNA polymerase-1
VVAVVTVTRDLEVVAREAGRLATGPVLAVDTETAGLDPLRDALHLVSLTNGREVLVCDVRGQPAGAVAQALRPVLEGGPLKVLHNAKFDLRMLLPLGLDAWPVADTYLTEVVLENGRRDTGFSLADLSRRYLGMPLDKGERGSFLRLGTFEALSAGQVEYAARDVLATYHCFLLQARRLRPEDAHRVARLESLAVRAFASMEHHGVHVDQAAWRDVLTRVAGERDQALADLHRSLAGVVGVDLLGRLDLNPDSDEEVRRALAKLDLHPPDTRAATLTGLPHPAPHAVVAYREAQKVLSTYGEGYLQHVHPASGRLHATFRQVGASTGRTSCERPNLQNVPQDSALRACFCAPPGRALVTADYAACELRILAHMSRDPVFLRAFQEGLDVHALVATQVFGVPVSRDQHPELRARAKAISFGLIYGMGAQGLALQTGQTLPEAEELLARYFRRFPTLDTTLRGLEQAARQEGYARTVLGRRLYIPAEAWDRDRGGAARLARNMPIQGTSADITKLAMAFIHDRLAGSSSFLVNTVHDEVLVECPLPDAQATAQTVCQEMERAMAVVIPAVPPRAEASAGPTWAKG